MQLLKITYRAFVTSACLIGALAATMHAQAQRGHLGSPIDWSFSHVIHHNATLSGFDAQAEIARKDPRLIYNWYRSVKAQQFSSLRRALPITRKPRNTGHTDWHFTLGAGTVAPNMYPAKFTFDINATPSCTGDFLIMGLNTAGSASQPNLVGFNNIYSGTTGSSFPITTASESGTTVTINTPPNTFATGSYVVIAGISPAGYNGTFQITVIDSAHFTYQDVSGLGAATTTGATAIQGGGCGANPTVEWAYNTGNPILTSPVLSIDGTKVAFIESGAGSATFKVLTLGTTGTSEGSFSAASNTYSAATPGSGGSNAVVVSTGSYSNAGNTRSSPFVDYDNDVAYFGDDNGVLYKTTCVFQCIGDPGIAWSVTIASGTKLASPVIDFNTQKLFVGASNGNLYMVSLASCPGCTVTSAAVGDSGTNGAIVDAPIVDSTFQTVFLQAGEAGTPGNTAPAVAVQLNESLTTLATDTFGHNAYTIPNGALDTEYYNNTLGSTNVTGTGYWCDVQGGSSQVEIAASSFSAKALAAGQITLATEAGTTVTITTSVAHGFTAGQTVVIAGFTTAGYNGTFTILATPTTTTFTYTDVAGLLSPAVGVLTATAKETLSTVNPPIMTTAPLVTTISSNNSGCSPFVTFTNGANEFLFFGESSVPSTVCSTGNARDGCLLSYAVTGSTGAIASSANATVHGGTSGIIVDNVSTLPQASSLYFAAQANTGNSTTAPACTYTSSNTAAYCAVKLTQAALQ